MAVPPLKTLFKSIADAIRSKKSTTTQIPATNFPSEIESIQLASKDLVNNTMSTNMEGSVVTVSKVHATPGSLISLQAYNPNSDNIFNGWYLGSTKVSSDEIIKYTMTGTGTLQAKYDLKYKVSVWYSPIAGKLSGLAPNGRYLPGSTCSLTFTLDGDSKSYVTFNGWYVDGSRVSTSTTYSFTVTKSVSIEVRTTTKALRTSTVTDLGWLATGANDYSSISQVFRAGDSAIILLGRELPSVYFDFVSGGDYTSSTCRGGRLVIINNSGTIVSNTSNSSNLYNGTVAVYNPNNKSGYYHGGWSSYVTKNTSTSTLSPYRDVNPVVSYSNILGYDSSLTAFTVANSALNGIGNGCGVATNGDTLFLGGVGNISVPKYHQAQGSMTRGSYLNTFLRITPSNTCTSSTLPGIDYCAFSIFLNLKNYTFIGIGSSSTVSQVVTVGSSTIYVNLANLNSDRRVAKLDTSGALSFLEDSMFAMKYSTFQTYKFPHFDQYTMNGKAVRISGSLIDVWDQSGTHTVIEYPNNGSYSTNSGFRTIEGTHIMYPNYVITTPNPTDDNPNAIINDGTGKLYTLDISLTLTNLNTDTSTTRLEAGVVLDNHRVIYAGSQHYGSVSVSGSNISYGCPKAYTYTYSFV